MAHITEQDVWMSENALANFKIRVCEILRLYFKTFIYMQVLCQINR